MSSHRRRVKHFDRKSGPRKALLNGMVVSLVEHGRITTTVDRAKEVRRHVEKAITVGKAGDLAATRLLLSRFNNNQDAVSAIIKDIAPRFKTRPGGYTRIIKIGRRPGDTAEMAFLEFVDYDYEAKGAAKETAKPAKAAKGEAKAAKAPAAKAKKASTKLVAAKKKSVKKIQKKDRAASRA
ncbi:50S ribosomal protein L17 [Bdellovibrio bacteriovorus]|uniref:Large ribosomal subunit protein bL17 n=1 Tax=Bdellovibrio bacteriovorus TaxID=959 RepID=A0A150WN15_BDEBC|nr:50S ribosomal protein L17 [Bdellovibrio bacteriovorus]KYG65852.1 50S ribosomal protein L17 [Bdellovibrio bacteriovorus]